MKKIILLLCAVIICFGLMAQENKTKQYVYCELVGYGNLTGTKVTVAVDYGVKTKFGADKRLKDANGKPIKFSSMVDAMNFMGLEGWEFVQAYTVDKVYHWLLKKTVEVSDSQIEEAKKVLEEE